MKANLPVSQYTDWLLILLATLVQFALVPHAHALSSQCTLAFNRVTSLMNQGETWMCSNQQQMLIALDNAAAACAADRGEIDFGKMKLEFIANSRSCLTGDGTQGGEGSGRSSPPATTWL